MFFLHATLRKRIKSINRCTIRSPFFLFVRWKRKSMLWYQMWLYLGDGFQYATFWNWKAPGLRCLALVNSYERILVAVTSNRSKWTTQNKHKQPPKKSLIIFFSFTLKSLKLEDKSTYSLFTFSQSESFELIAMGKENFQRLRYRSKAHISTQWWWWLNILTNFMNSCIECPKR